MELIILGFILRCQKSILKVPLKFTSLFIYNDIGRNNIKKKK